MEGSFCTVIIDRDALVLHGLDILHQVARVDAKQSGLSRRAGVPVGLHPHRRRPWRPHGFSSGWIARIWRRIGTGCVRQGSKVFSVAAVGIRGEAFFSIVSGGMVLVTSALKETGNLLTRLDADTGPSSAERRWSPNRVDAPGKQQHVRSGDGRQLQLRRFKRVTGSICAAWIRTAMRWAVQRSDSRANMAGYCRCLS
jgi:hypothetical protein